MVFSCFLIALGFFVCEMLIAWLSVEYCKFSTNFKRSAKDNKWNKNQSPILLLTVFDIIEYSMGRRNGKHELKYSISHFLATQLLIQTLFCYQVLQEYRRSGHTKVNVPWLSPPATMVSPSVTSRVVARAQTQYRGQPLHARGARCAPPPFCMARVRQCAIPCGTLSRARRSAACVAWCARALNVTRMLIECS